MYSSLNLFEKDVKHFWKGFTLAEVLITLGIIGVVAALTMPSIIARQNEKATVARLKKVYSVLNQAYLRAKEEYGPVSTWKVGISGTEVDEEGNSQLNEIAIQNSDILHERLGKYLNVVKFCKASDTTCEKYDTMYTLDGTVSVKDFAHIPFTYLNDGTVIFEGWLVGGGTSDFAIDINGKQGPNTMGKDIFYFILTDKAILPYGMDGSNYRPFETYCNTQSSNGANGYGCTAWVLYNENLDYLHCNDLSWSGKHRCK